MTDLEITKLCAEAMGFDKYEWKTIGIISGTNIPISLPTGQIQYDPLHDDAQAMALVKKFHVHQEWSEGRHGDHWQALCWDYAANRWTEIQRKSDLNRAICECVAKMQRAKETT